MIFRKADTCFRQLLAQSGHSPDFVECPLPLHNRHSILPPAVQKPRSKAIFVRVQSAINNRRTKAVISNAGDFAAANKACETVANIVAESNTKAREQAVTDVIAFIGATKK